MEKRKPHCKLEVVKALIDADKIRMTATAVRGAGRLGLDPAGMIEVVRALTPADFYKSMTTLDDHTIWQDVYRPSTAFGDIYLKLTVVEDVLVVSFKEL